MKKICIKSVILLFSFLFTMNACKNKQNNSTAPNSMITRTDTVFIHDTLRITPEVNPVRICCTKISASKMNVLYVGVDNPINIESAEEQKITAVNGILNFDPSTKKYMVQVKGGTEMHIDAQSVLDSSCSTSQQFRIKRIPDPVVYVGNIKGSGFITKSEASNQRGLFARMENFDFDVKFNVISFTMLTVVNGLWVSYPGVGQSFTADMQRALSTTTPGSRIIIERVKVSGPDGTIREIPGVVLTIK